MKHNMGTADRIIRILIAVLIAGLFLISVIGGLFAYVLLAVAGIFLLTAIVGSCPLYSLFGFKTYRVKQSS